MSNDSFFERLTKMYAAAGLPVAILGSDFQLLWCSEKAQVIYPSLSQPDGVQALLSGYSMETIKAEISASGFFATDGGGNLFTDRAITLCALSGKPERYLLQPSYSPHLGTGTHPEGISRSLATFDMQFRAPLFTIFSAVGLLSHCFQPNDQTLDPKQAADYLDQVNQSTYQLLRSYEWISRYTRLTNGLSPLRLTQVELYAHLRQLFTAAGDVIKENGIPFTCSIPTGVLITACDLDKLSGAILNLLSNACRFTRPDNRIEIRVRQRTHSVSISIKDHGVGIPAQVLPRIFEPYFSYGGSGLPFAGNGLGLCIAKESVEAMGGVLTLSSVEHQGTSVVFTIPIRQNEDTPYAVENTAVDYLADRFSPLRIALCDSLPCRLDP